MDPATGNPVLNQTPTLTIYRDLDNKYLDFASGEWVSSGGTKKQVMSELGDGLYYWDFDQSKYGENCERDYTVYYENLGAYAGVASEQIKFRYKVRPGSIEMV